MGKRCTMGFQPFQNEQGAILVIALAFVCVLAISGTMAYQMTANEFLIARNFDDSRGALNAASAGIEEARVRLGLPSGDTFAISNPNPGSSDKWTPSPNSFQTDADYHIEIQHKTNDDGDFFYYGYDDPSSPDYLTVIAFPTPDPTEYRPIDIITSTMTSTGAYKNSGIEIRAEVVRNPGPPILAALYVESDVDGDADADDDGTIDLSISGIDNCAFTPSVTCPQCGTAPNKDDLYVCTSSTTTTIEVNNPTLTTGITLGLLNINISQGITSLKEWEASPGSGESNCYNPNYNICNSDVDPVTNTTTITNQTGSGVLLVEGNLIMEGTTWNGLILVTGELTLNGGAGIVIEGAVLANWKVWINDTNPGPVTINYNSCAIDAALSSIPLRVLSWEDMSITE